AAQATISSAFSQRSIGHSMRVSDPKLLKSLAELGVELKPAAKLSESTSLGIGGTTDLLRIAKHESIPDLLQLLDAHHIPHRFLGGASNPLVDDGELSWVGWQPVRSDRDVVREGHRAYV